MIFFVVLLNLSLLLWLGWGAVYQLFFALSGLFFSKKNTQNDAYAPGKTAVFIPACQEDGVIIGTVESVLRQDYPTDCFEVIVIADRLKPATLETLKTFPVSVVEVQFENSTKSKALNAAIEWLGNRRPDFETAVVIDADNHMAPGSLWQMNAVLQAGALAVQGQRAPKNLQSAFAMLDAASESANNHILCRGHRALGLSARLAGSGMAFDFNLFCTVMCQIDAVGGFDKELELRLTQLGVRIEYNEDAIVLDEKVSRSDTFSKQRSRWIAAQFKYARRFVPAAAYALVRHGSLDFFNKAMQMTLPPRLLLPGFLLSGMLINYALLGISDLTVLWSLMLACNLLTFAIALPGFVYQPRHFRLWAQIPAAFFATITALFHVRTASKYFLVTPKSDLF
jgi:cellulose synthase/poly-beta-1,6-N-acetylglucosamine synthase-like glycosyltransferase